MRNFIDIISKGLTPTLTAETAVPLMESTETIITPETLLEGKHFEAMFAGIEGLAKRYGQEVITEQLADIKNTVKALKRNDRQAWAARILRIWMLDQMSKWTIGTFQNTAGDTMIGQKEERFEQFKSEVARMDAKYQGEYQKTFGKAFIQDVPIDPKRTIKQMILNHYLGMPYAKIQNYVFNKGFVDTLADLSALENEFKERTKSLLSLHEGDKIIIRMPDNFVWVALSRGYCSEEANAMGHCGNAGAKANDQILSLRRIKDVVDGVPYMEVFLTFILNGDGYLGEMKGRGNDKPAAKYHSQIITLLENPIVKGIRGGGWLPKNNFSLDDLPEDVKAKLLDTHPHLGGWQARLQKAMKTGTMNKEFLEGFIKAFRDSHPWSDKAELIEADGDQPSLTPNEAKYEVVAHQWSGVDEMIDEMSDDDHTKEVASGEYRTENYDTPSDDRLETFLDGMPVQWQIAIGKHVLAQMEADGVDEDEIEDFDMSSSREVVSKLEEYDSEMYMHMQHAVMSGEESGADSEAHEYLMKAVQGFQPKIGTLVLSKYKKEGTEHLAPSQQEGIVWDSPVKIILSMSEAAKLMDENANGGDDEYEYDDDSDLKSVMFPDEELKIEPPYYGYSGFDEDSAMERFTDEADLGEFEPKGRAPEEPDFDNMPKDDLKQWIEQMYQVIPDGFVRKVHPDTLPDDRLVASAKGLFKKYYAG